MSKYFQVNPMVNYADKKIVQKIQSESQKESRQKELRRYEDDNKKLLEKETLVHTPGRVVVKVDLDYKNRHQLNSGLLIRRERQYNEFNRRVSEPVNCIVISGENIPTDTEILIHPNGIHDTYRVFDYKKDAGDIKYYSIPQDMCFAYFDNGWKPLAGYDFALRVYKPYGGLISGIAPTLVKNCLYVTTGDLSGKAVMTLPACDYCIIFQGKDLREERIIRFRAFGNEKEKREPEAIAILHEVTAKIIEGEYLVGIEVSDAKPLEINAYAD